MTAKETGGERSERLRVMVVDDHALFRRGLEMVLQQEPDIELVGEASDGAEAVETAQEVMPDIVLMDVRMPKRSGIEAAGADQGPAAARARSSCSRSATRRPTSTTRSRRAPAGTC